jgi:hypothetical protein
MSLYPENPEIGEIFNNRQWSGTAWVALNNPLSVEYTTDGEFTEHTSASANVHGIINSASVVYADDTKLSDERTPTNGSVTDAKIASGGLSASVITGTAVVTADSRLSDQRTPLDNSVTSAKIVDGTIVNADINASAEIAPSKVSGTAVVDNDARLTNERVPTNGSVTDAKIASGGLSASVITGGAVVQNDLNAYLTQSSASSTYLTQAGASTIYAPSASPTFTGTVGLPVTTNYDGTQLSTTLASKLDIQAQQSNRNLLYNGAMQVHQRGTSVTGITSTGYYTADRWIRGVNAMGTWTHTIENDAPTGSGFRKSFRVLCTTADSSPAAGDFNTFDQALEGQDVQRIRKGTYAAEQLTLSFWVKSNVTGTYIVNMVDIDNSRSVSASYQITASATWEKKTITFPADTTGVLDNDNQGSLNTVFFLGAGSTFTSGTLNTTWSNTIEANRAVGQTNLAAATNNYWQITGVQLETGLAATPFEFKSFGQELRECQRYYTHSNSPQPFSATSSLGAGIVSKPVYTNFAATGFTTFPVPMRTTPVVTVYNTTTGNSGSIRLQSTSTNITAAAEYIGVTGFGGVFASGNNFTTTDFAFVPFQANAEL